MARVIFTNQNRHLYVASAYNATVNDSSAVGTIGRVKTIGEGIDKDLFFSYKGADSAIHSDRINLHNLNYAKAFKASDMVIPLKKIKVALDSTVNSGNPVTGQDYVLGINFLEWIGPSETYQYVKDAAVHATAAMTADKKLFYKAMVAELNAAFSREVGATKDSNPYLTFSAGTAGSEDGIYITEKEQEWARGTESFQRVKFDVYTTTIYTGGEDLVWGTITDQTPAKASAVVGTTGVGNGKMIADLEWFCAGERGDQYRNMGWPNVIDTTYLVDPTKQYNVLEFHFAFRDEGVNSYRSEKEITVVFPLSDTSGGGGATVYDDINDFIGAINTAVGTTLIATLSD